MDIEIDVTSAEAVYEQIVRQIQQAVRVGALRAGAPLPSIRQFADDLDLNHNTVAKAYKILENNRVIRTAGRKGTFISADAARSVEQRNREDAAHVLDDAVRLLADKGLTARQIESAFAAVMAHQFNVEGE